MLFPWARNNTIEHVAVSGSMSVIDVSRGLLACVSFKCVSGSLDVRHSSVSHGEKSEDPVWFPYMRRDFGNSMAWLSTNVMTVKQRCCLQPLKTIATLAN